MPKQEAHDQPGYSPDFLLDQIRTGDYNSPYDPFMYLMHPQSRVALEILVASEDPTIKERLFLSSLVNFLRETTQVVGPLDIKHLKRQRRIENVGRRLRRTDINAAA